MDEEERKRIRFIEHVISQNLARRLLNRPRITISEWFQKHPASTYEDKKRPGFIAKGE
jgi:hypothetical protein